RPRIAVDAAVLAAPVGIDRLFERDVRGIVARDDRAGALFRYRGRNWIFSLFFRSPTVVKGRARLGLESALDLRKCAAKFGHGPIIRSRIAIPSKYCINEQYNFVQYCARRP